MTISIDARQTGFVESLRQRARRLDGTRVELDGAAQRRDRLFAPLQLAKNQPMDVPQAVVAGRAQRTLDLRQEPLAFAGLPGGRYPAEKFVVVGAPDTNACVAR